MKPVEDLISYYKNIHKENLTSVYLRGSVPRGTMVNSISDIDSFCLTHTEFSEDTTASVEKYQSYFSGKYRFVNGVEIESYSKQNALQMKSMRFLLKTQCLCIAGADVATEIEPMVISADSLSTCHYLSKINDDFIKDAKTSESEEDALDLCSWIFKMALRAAFEIVMLREKKYTRDIYFCWLSYSNYYPKHADLLKQALYLVVNPTSDIPNIRTLWEQIFKVLKESMTNNEYLIT